jgi:hypothetical protein
MRASIRHLAAGTAGGRPAPAALAGAALLLLLPLLAGCADDAPPAGLTDPDAALAGAHGPPAAPILVEDAGFELPEAVVHDAHADVYLVSNVGGDGSDLLAANNNGFISRLAPDGTVLELRWIEGTADAPLHGPAGMALVGDVLYVADRDAVRAYDRVTGAPVAAYPAPEGTGLLNDVCAGPRGELYVTDTGLDEALEPTGSDAVYRLVEGEFVPVAVGTALAGPNGCAVQGGNVFWVTFFSNQILRTNPSGRVFTVATLPGGQIDGIVAVRGSWYVTSWESEGVYRTPIGGGRAELVVADFPFPAALGYDATRHRLLVPSLLGNVVLIHPL